MSFTRNGYWITGWNPDDRTQWTNGGRRVAARNMVFSLFTEHVAISIWSMWSVLVLFLGPEYGFTPQDKFLLTAMPTLLGGLLRVPYTFAVARFGGRNWTIFSSAALLIPCVLLGFLLEPGVSLGTLLLVSSAAGLGGANFASSMANIHQFFPERLKGGALGLNACGGNLGVSAVQLVALIVIATLGVHQPKVIVWIYVPLIVLTVVTAALFMDNLAGSRSDARLVLSALKDKDNLVLSFLYIGTFGSFVGYSFAFGLVLQLQFGYEPRQALYWTFLGPFVGSLTRILGGRWADRLGGALVSTFAFVSMAGFSGGLVVAAQLESFPTYVSCFLGLFVVTGIGNGSVYKMIPAVYRASAASDIANGADPTERQEWSRLMTSAVIGVVSAVGALGGLAVNIAFRQAFLTTGSGSMAVLGFCSFYILCVALIWAVYLRPTKVPYGVGTQLSLARV
ncbi:NarK/NasA family nitrate transporter [Mycobacterium sp. Aquia_216]|uniref:MFS transporter n=1 Tax=Mycobacterium sp. Aquia_216 TaxID=2991729 RepID=UPI00227B9B65|nr:nitrate/nitrite transporter [Mycobacterium sp. Aquia_216]WAJ43033.1 NarK/NasA family nitrate transporter [Mycobacterium sp. Aquia_216]